MPEPTKTTAAQKPPVETVTDWSVFEKLRLNPKLIKCDSYHPTHMYDASCHTVLRPKVESIISHINSDHSGAFYLELNQIPEGAKVWTGWADLRALGAEVTDFRGARRMGSPIGVTAHEIRPLMSNHIGDNKRTCPGGGFYLTITLPRVVEQPADEE